jgi:hypothetical protein
LIRNPALVQNQSGLAPLCELFPSKNVNLCIPGMVFLRIRE